MRPLSGLLLSLAFLAAGTAGSDAQDSQPAKALASNYQLSDAVGERRCPITLETRTAPGGFALIIDREVCGVVFPHLSDVAAWRPAPARGINFVDAKGNIVTEFTEGVGGVYEAIRDNDGVYFLTNLKIADAEEIKFDDLVGDWNLSRPGGATICRITLTKDAAAEQRFAIRVASGCDAPIASFGLASWQLSNGDVLLYAANGDLLRLGKNEEGQWARVPDQKQPRPRPLLMTR